MITSAACRLKEVVAGLLELLLALLARGHVDRLDALDAERLDYRSHRRTLIISAAVTRTSLSSSTTASSGASSVSIREQARGGHPASVETIYFTRVMPRHAVPLRRQPSADLGGLARYET